MSDLHCAARMVVTRSDAAPDLAGHLVGERVAVVLTDAWQPARGAASELAEQLGTSCEHLPEGSLREVLDDVADLHRGETLVVVADRDWPGTLGRAADGQGAVLVEIDADGWRTTPLGTTPDA